MPDVLYNDGVKSIFLYTKGEKGGTKKLKDLLKYISESNSSNVADTELETLHGLVNGVKHKEGIGDRYMTFGDVMDYEREIGVEIGIERERQNGMEILIISNHECGIDEDVTIKTLQKMYNLDEEQALELIALVKAKM